MDNKDEGMFGLISLEEALGISAADNMSNHQMYINPEFVKMLKLIDFNKIFVKAEGCTLWDNEGNEYLDFLGAFSALNLGHNHPEIQDKMKMAMTRPNFLQVALNPLAGALAHNLARITPGKLQISFLGNSGAEAVEGALKLARAATNRIKIVSCNGSFHGKTVGALSVTGREKYRKPFTPLLPGVEFVDFGDAEALEAALAKKDVAAFIVEPIQGEGGIIVPPEGYLKQARRICTETKTLLIVDEIQTGLGRTGKLFACEHDEIAPDIMCLAKSLGGGVMPLSAYIATEKVWKSAYGSMDKATLHTSTFGGNSMAAAAGIAAIEVLLRENLAEQAEKKGEYLLAKLAEVKEKHPLVEMVRGRGLMIGIEFRQEEHNLLDRMTREVFSKMAKEYLGTLIAGELLNKHNMITAYTLNNPNVIRLEPPLTVTYAQMDRFVSALDEVLKENKGFLSATKSSAKTMMESMFKSGESRV